MGKTNVSISVGVFDNTAKGDLTSSINCPLQPFSDIGVFTQDALDMPRYATLEPDRFVLDGTYVPFPDDMSTAEFGVWGGEMSTGSGALSQPLVLTMQFSEEHACIGLTFHFDEAVGEHPQHAVIQWFNSDGLTIANFVGDVTGPNWYVKRPVSRFTKITATFTGTVPPLRYMKLTGIDFGKLLVARGEDVLSASLVEELSPTGTELPDSQIDFELLSDEDEFNLLNPTNVFIGLRERQQISVKATVNGKLMDMGTFYVDSWEASSQSRAVIRGIGVIGLLDKASHPGGMYNCSAGELYAEILGEMPYELDAGIAAVPINGWLPPCTRKEALQQLATATCAVVDASRGGPLRIVPLSFRAVGRIAYDRKLNGSSLVKRKEPVTDIQITSHSYRPGIEQQQLAKQTLAAGQHTIALSEPCHGYSITGGSIVASHPNSITFTTGGGEVTVMGYKYQHTETLHNIANGEAPLGVAENVISVEQATLVSPALAKNVAANLLRYYNQDIHAEFRMMLEEEQLGELLEVLSFGGQKLRGFFQRMDIDLAGGFLANVTLAGKQAIPEWRYHTTELIAGAGGVL